MQWKKKYQLSLLLLLISFLEAHTQENFSLKPPAEKDTAVYAPFVVRNIIITGNRKTKSQIILREVPFKSGDYYQLQTLVQKFEDARRQLMNTSLFNEVIVALKSFDGYNVDVLISVKERWYLFPVPYFNIVARDVNEWVKVYNSSLQRVNYGIKVVHNNFTGRKDELKVGLINGYTRQISLSYNRPYFDKQMKWGFNFGVERGKNRDINYITVDNRQVILDSVNQYIHSFFRSKFELTYRRAIKTTHRFGFAYTYEKVADTVTKLNPYFFKGGRNRIQFPHLYYNLTYFDVDYIPYPLKGYVANILISKKGSNNTINEWQLTAKGSGTWPIAKHTYFNLIAVGSVKAPFRQPFFNQRFLGYEDMMMQGYEMYVVDGVAGGYLKTTFSRNLFNLNVKIPSRKLPVLNSIPFRFYGKVYGNAGYVHNPQGGDNFLTNKMLYSAGLGLDVVTIYDFVIKLEWSFNSLGQNGLYLHRKNHF